MSTQRVKMEKNEIGSIVRLTRSVFSLFYNKMIDIGVFIRDKKDTYISDKYVTINNLTSMHMMGISSEEYRFIFNSVDVRQIGKIGRVLLLMSNVNKYTGLICEHLKCECDDMASAYKISEISDIIIYSRKNIGKYIDWLSKIKDTQGDGVIKINDRKVYLNENIFKYRDVCHNNATAVYRLYNNMNECIYVGISNNVNARLLQHSSTKSWYDEVNSIESSKYINRNEARIYEIYYISKLSPKHNDIFSRDIEGFCMSIIELDFNIVDEGI
jgi:hypothetical protein